MEADGKHLQRRQLELLWLLEGQSSMMVDLFSQEAQFIVLKLRERNGVVGLEQYCKL